MLAQGYTAAGGSLQEECESMAVSSTCHRSIKQSKGEWNEERH